LVSGRVASSRDWDASAERYLPTVVRSATHFLNCPTPHLLLISSVTWLHSKYWIPTGSVTARSMQGCRASALCGVESCPRAFCAAGLRSLCVKTQATSSLCRHHQKSHRGTKSPNDPPPPRSASPHRMKELQMFSTHAEQPYPVQGHRYDLWRLGQSLGTVSWME
jgi:hypothetical protein